MSESQPSKSSQAEAASPVSRWPNRLAWVLVCAVFPLVWMGGFVTTYDAGMAVHDWPTTFGHWFYPFQKWLWNINDLFLEHGHRTIGQVVGVLAIALVVVVWRTDGRKWMRWLTVIALLGVILQGTLGGLRVLCRKWEDSIGNWEQVLAGIHGCTAPLVFSLCAAMVAFTSTTWRNVGQRPLRPLRTAEPAMPHAHAKSTHRTALAVTIGLYLMIVIGAQMRHPPTGAPHGWFVFWVWMKVIGATVVYAAVVAQCISIARRLGDVRGVLRRAQLLTVLASVQVLLGIGTWITNYGIPGWFRNYIWTVSYTVTAEGPLQAWTTTAHTAVGSLTLVASLSLTLWSYRLIAPEIAPETSR